MTERIWRNTRASDPGVGWTGWNGKVAWARRRAEELGLDHGIAGDDAWAEAVLEVTQGRGVDVIQDLVGGPDLAGNQRVLARGGRLIVVGVTGGPSHRWTSGPS